MGIPSTSMNVIAMETKVSLPSPSPIATTVRTHFTSENSDAIVTASANTNSAVNTNRNSGTLDAEGTTRTPDCAWRNARSYLQHRCSENLKIPFPYAKPSLASFMLT